MNERLKLRAWNKKENKYFYLEKSEKLKEMGLGWYGWANHELEEIYPMQAVENFEDVWGKIEFPSDIPDRNGKLIYEGDIVGNYAFIDVVIFKDGVYSTSRSIGNQPLSIHNDIEVVGTYNENPELLEE